MRNEPITLGKAFAATIPFSPGVATFGRRLFTADVSARGDDVRILLCPLA